MNRVQILLLGAALIAALLAAYLIQGIIQQPAPPPASAPAVQKIDTVDVLVAARNIARGEKLSNSAVQWVPWPRDMVGPNLISQDSQPDALEKFAAARAASAMVAGEPVLEAKAVFPKDGGFLSAILPPGMRAISVPISETSAASGFILPNDRVDVVLTRKAGDDGSNTASTSKTVLSNVRVLAINQTFDSGESPSIADARTAVLELYPNQAEVLANIQSSGSIALVLRSLAESGNPVSPNDQPKLSPGFGDGPVIIRYGVERGSRNK